MELHFSSPGWQFYCAQLVAGSFALYMIYREGRLFKGIWLTGRVIASGNPLRLKVGSFLSFLIGRLITAFIVVGMIVLIMSIGFKRVTGSFVVLKCSPESVVLEYPWPSQTRRFSMSEIDRVKTTSNGSRLLLRMKWGALFKSAEKNRVELEREYGRMIEAYPELHGSR